MITSKKRPIIFFWGLIVICIGILFSFQNWFVPNLYKEKYYSPLALPDRAKSEAFDPTIYYGSKTREFMDGHWTINDPFIWEYKNKPSPFNLGEMVPTAIMATLAKLVGGIDKAFILSCFIFPPVSFLLISFLIYLATRKPWLSACGSLITIFFFLYLKYYPFLPSIINLIIKAPIHGYLSPLSGIFHPQITFPFFLATTIFIWLIIMKSSYLKKIRWLFLGISLAILTYSYIFFWIYALAWIILLIGWLWIKKEKVINLELIKALITFILLSLPYFFAVYKFYQSGLLNSFIKIASFSSGKYFLSPEDIKWILYSLIFIFLSFCLNKNKQKRLFWVSFFATFIGLILAVKVLGVENAEIRGHWLIRIIWPFTFIILLSSFIERVKIDFKYLALILSIILLSYQFIAHYQFYKNNYWMFLIEPERIELFNWFNSHTEKDSVVITASLRDNLYIPVYTHNNVLVPRAFLSIVPAEESLERYLLANKLLGVPKERVEMTFSATEKNLEGLNNNFFYWDGCAGHHLFFRLTAQEQYYRCWVTDEKKKNILEQFDIMENNISDWQEKYRIDYYLWGPYEKQWSEINPETISGIIKVWENNSFTVYKINLK